MMNQRQLEKEWVKIIKAEGKYIDMNLHKKESGWQKKLDKFVPDKLADSMNAAFSKAFEVIFEKGTGLIEKTYNKEKREKEHAVDAYAADTLNSRRSMKVFGKKAKSSQNVNTLISAVEGLGMGAVGAGLPDIPVFISVLLKSIYEIATIYGFSYDSEREQIFILKMIETALAHESDLLKGNAELNSWLKEPSDFDIPKSVQIKRTSLALSNELLYLKFVQGMPIVGVAGGISDVIYQKKITDYAELKYKRRFLSENREKPLDK